jgi:hypothetical protein
MDKITELLGVNKLDESVQTDITNKLQEMVESKVTEEVKEKITLIEKTNEEKVNSLVETKLEEEKSTIKAELVEEYEEKFEDYKVDITEKFSLFVDDILKEKLEIPSKVYEYAKKGELYTDLIEEFKSRIIIDENKIDEDTKDLMREAKEEIENLMNEKNEAVDKYLTAKQLLSEAKTNIYLHKKCEGLTETQKKTVFNLLEDVKDTEAIDTKFDFIVENFNSDVITEEKENIQVIDTDKAIEALKKVGVKATAVGDDEISVDLKDKKKVVK